MKSKQRYLYVFMHEILLNISKPIFLENGLQFFFSQGQKCLRKCSSDEDCKSKKKKCLCDGACGMSCIKPGKFVISVH